MMLLSNPDQLQDGFCIIGEADPFLAQLLQRFVEKSGFRSKIAQSGEAVLGYAAEDGTVLIVLEPELPGKVRGWEAVHKIKSDVNTCTIPIILCAWLNEADAQALVGHALKHLQKPELHYNDFLSALSAAGVLPSGK